MVIWINGLSASGKTTIGMRLAEKLRTQCENVVYLDGDILRDVWGDSLGHDVQSRYLNATRISNLCLLLDRQRIHVVAAVMSMFPEWQAWNRKHFSRYFEVFLDVPMETLYARELKGLYRAFNDGKLTQVVGVDIPFPRPACPDMIIDNTPDLPDPSVLADRILAAMPPLSAP